MQHKGIYHLLILIAHDEGYSRNEKRVHQIKYYVFIIITCGGDRSWWTNIIHTVIIISAGELLVP
jgi:hypothetical protein